MNLVNEQDGWLSGIRQAVCRSGQDPPHIRDIRFDSAQPLELVLGVTRNELSKGSLTRARRAVKNQ